MYDKENANPNIQSQASCSELKLGEDINNDAIKENVRSSSSPLMTLTSDA